MAEGQIENWTSIINLGNASLLDLGSTSIDTIKFLPSMFRSRIIHTFIVNAPGSVNWIWKAMQGFLKEEQLRKISITDRSDIPKHASNYIHPSQIEKKFGGSMDNITQFW